MGALFRLFGGLVKFVAGKLKSIKPTSPVKQPNVKPGPAQSPTPVVKPQSIKGNKPQESDTFWQDRIKAKSSEDMKEFYEKYRTRLQNQDPHLKP